MQHSILMHQSSLQTQTEAAQQQTLIRGRVVEKAAREAETGRATRSEAVGRGQTGNGVMAETEVVTEIGRVAEAVESVREKQQQSAARNDHHLLALRTKSKFNRQQLLEDVTALINVQLDLRMRGRTGTAHESKQAEDQLPQ